jgi:predicted small integral membrane protein
MTTSPIPTQQRSWWRTLATLPMVVLVLTACNALYIALVAFGNITDFDTNYAFVQHVLAMDTTNFGQEPGTGLDPDVMWRAIEMPWIWTAAYVGVIVWEMLAALVLIAACVAWVRAFAGRRAAYDTPRALSTIGLLMIVVLFFGGFITIGGEWFNMWRSVSWNGLDPAFRNATLAAITLVLIHTTSQAWVRDRHGEGAAAARTETPGGR